jgi:hypothetical protein
VDTNVSWEYIASIFRVGDWWCFQTAAAGCFCSVEAALIADLCRPLRLTEWLEAIEQVATQCVMHWVITKHAAPMN